MKKIIILLSVLSFIGCNCEDDEINCERSTLVDNIAFVNDPSHHVNIIETEITDDCLRIKFGTSGCSDEGWNVKLIDSEEIIYTSPAKRTVRLSVQNTGLCEAAFTKEMTFDLSVLQLNTETELTIVLDNNSAELNYVY